MDRSIQESNVDCTREVNVMRTSLFLATVVLAASTAGAAERSAGERIDDATLSAKVKAVLAADDAVKARQIDVETRDGVVQLSGLVDSQDTIDAALVAARSVEGIKEVRNDLGVRDQERSAGTDDTIIAARVKGRMDEADLADESGVNVDVEDGVVQLSGFATTIEEKNRAGEVASRVDGVRDVRNNIALLK